MILDIHGFKIIFTSEIQKGTVVRVVIDKSTCKAYFDRDDLKPR
jgi:predicted RNA-binding protein with TRAM domain